ncbi:P-loop containing nucleoside triphosphate hydrolase protein [Scheffersomyces amazonensis]|uniref:P-loop containing nucleoside triphosphate hydrolase protein n=1 Tax=Scheffersomyces amazonensis TaxID=1078765 RepID=UPI00315CD090
MLRYGCKPCVRSVNVIFQRYKTKSYSNFRRTERSHPATIRNIIYPVRINEIGDNLHAKYWIEVRKRAPSTLEMEKKHWLESEPPLTKQEINDAQALFNKAKVKLEWTLADYDEIPDVKYRRLRREREESIENMDPFKRTEYHNNLLKSRKLLGTPPEALIKLPEILLLGHANAGKSTLINNLLMKKGSDKLDKIARVSERAGFTQTLNCYNIGGKLRIIDSPGYGMYGKLNQGKLVMDYITRRDRLAGAFVLIDIRKGIRPEDRVLLECLQDNEINHDVIFTKFDQFIQEVYPLRQNRPTRLLDIDKAMTYSDRMNSIARDWVDEVIKDMPYSQRCFFNNALTSEFVPQVSGYKHVRAAILQKCKEFEN